LRDRPRRFLLVSVGTIFRTDKDNTSTVEDLQEENSRTLGNYSRRLQDYSRISWSTFQPRDASSVLEDFWLVVFGDASRLLVKAIKTTRIYHA
jgi:hypothetical protein